MDSVLCQHFNRCDELAIFFTASVPVNHLRYKSASLHASVPFRPICASLTGIYLITAPLQSPQQSTILARWRRAPRGSPSLGRSADGRIHRQASAVSRAGRDRTIEPAPAERRHRHAGSPASIADRFGAGRRWLQLGAETPMYADVSHPLVAPHRMLVVLRRVPSRESRGSRGSHRSHRSHRSAPWAPDPDAEPSAPTITHSCRRGVVYMWGSETARKQGPCCGLPLGRKGEAVGL